MKITYDPQKDLENRRKHGIGLSDAQSIDWSTLWERQDIGLFYGEIRLIGLVLIGVRLHCVIYTDRDDVRRIISLRKATPTEVKLYASNN